MNRRLTLGLLSLVLAGCGDSSSQAKTRPEAEDGPLIVAAVHYPLAYVAERIGGSAVEVVFPVPPDVDPAFWQPEADDIVSFQEADLILLNGAGYAKWTSTATLPASRLVDTSSSFTDRLLERKDLVTHSHGPEGEHSHAGTAFTTWLDLELLIQHAAAVRDALVAHLPENAGAFEEAYRALEADLRALDQRLAAAVAPSPERVVIFSHPVYDYLASRYGIQGVSLHLEPGDAPTAEQWTEIAGLAAEHQVRWLVWEGEPLPSTLDALTQRGIRSVVFAPCGNRPDEGDLLAVMANNAEALERVFGASD